MLETLGFRGANSGLNWRKIRRVVFLRTRAARGKRIPGRTAAIERMQSMSRHIAGHLEAGMDGKITLIGKYENAPTR